MKDFYSKLDKPFFALAPMAGITDSPFRQICKRFGADVLYSELASSTALAYAPEKTLELVRFDDIERPYVVQLFGSKPEHFEKAAKIISEQVKPDGIDINFGCPVPKVLKQGAGAELMKDVRLSKDCIKAVLNSTNLPVSIKTRTRSGDVGLVDLLDEISDLDIKAIMVHGRTLAQGFSGPIDTETIKAARDHFGGMIIANGGVMKWEDAWELLDMTGADGIGIGQGALGRPWIFNEIKNKRSMTLKKDKISEIILEHSGLSEKILGHQGILELRKHLCWYVKGLEGAAELRRALVKVESLEDIRKIIL